MKTYQRIFICALIALLLALPSTAFARDASGDDAFIWKDGKNVFVRFAAQDDGRFGENDHPVTLAASDVSNALSMLAIVPKSPGKVDRPVFTRTQVSVLSEHLTLGLSRARANQDIVFALQSVVTNRLGMKTGRVFVAGRAFYQDNRLNLIVGEHDHAKDSGFEGAYDPTHLGIVSFNFDHGKRALRSKLFKKSIVEARGVTVRRIDQTARGDWAQVDIQLAALAAQSAAEPSRNTVVTPHVQNAVLKVPPPPPVRPDTKAAAPAAMPEPVMPSPPASPAPDRSIAERLTILEDLRSKGLISDEEYSSKRRQILDAL